LGNRKLQNPVLLLFFPPPSPEFAIGRRRKTLINPFFAESALELRRIFCLSWGWAPSEESESEDSEESEEEEEEDSEEDSE
jgi:hypothetical protein